MNSVIATSPKHLGYCCRSDNFDYFLYKLDGLVYHLNHYSPLLELDDFILTTVREARMALLPSQEQSPQCRFLFPFNTKSVLRFQYVLALYIYMISFSSTRVMYHLPQMGTLII